MTQDFQSSQNTGYP